jgi:2-succinyl-5-enolpyruvyl-6-hydroxy-3-cyclohexene-1-carboxylate synthase
MEWQWGAERDPSAEELASVAERVSFVERGVIVCGPRAAMDGLPPAVTELSRATGYPVLAEAASGVRWAAETDLVSQYDLFLRHGPTAKALTPKLILRFGGGLTSKPLQEWLDRSTAPVVLFSDDGAAVDPAHQAVTLIRANAALAARALATKVNRGHGDWAASFHRAQAACAKALHQVFQSQQGLTEPLIAHETARALPEGGRLFVASSMPVRDLDAFGTSSARLARVLSNRGVNGIDGTLSSAIGVAAASKRPTVALVGDLAFLHDLNGLLIARRHDIPLTVVVVNNDGGGIFSFLPVAKIEQHFEELFGTPHGLNLAHAAALFDAAYVEPRSSKELRAALTQHVGRGLCIVNARVDRHESPVEHQALYAKAHQALEELSWP